MIDITRLDLFSAASKWLSSLAPSWMLGFAAVGLVALVLGLFVGLVAEMMYAQMEASLLDNLHDYLDDEN